MHRRDLLTAALGGAAMALFSGRVRPAAAAASAGQPALPARKKVRVAFLLGDHANVIDTAGPWEVFQDVMLPRHRHPFSLYTVAPSKKVIRMTGGLLVQPQHTFDDAPQPHVIVVPAQKTADAALAWLKRASDGTDVTLSVCTGAFQLARAGLLDEVPATTHHLFWDKFAVEFPHIELRRGLRFVDSGRIATAGGLTSGIDMALHVVQRYYGTDVAAATAKYMEYDCDAWRAGS